MQSKDYYDFSVAMEEYHKFTETVAIHPGAGTGSLSELSYLALGLNGETGEFTDVLKKLIRRGGQADGDGEKFVNELGDILFYWNRLCYALDIDPGDVMLANVAKLQTRQKAGTLKDRSDS